MGCSPITCQAVDGPASLVSREGAILTPTRPARVRPAASIPTAGTYWPRSTKGFMSDIYSYNFDTERLSQTSSGANSPSWSPTATASSSDSKGMLFPFPQTAAQNPSRSWPRRTSASPIPDLSHRWRTWNSTYVFVRQGSATTAADIWMLRVIDGERTLEPLVVRPRNQWSVRVSPDGRWISYASDESDQFEVYVQHSNETLPDPISTCGCCKPSKRADERSPTPA